MATPLDLAAEATTKIVVAAVESKQYTLTGDTSKQSGENLGQFFTSAFQAVLAALQL